MPDLVSPHDCLILDACCVINTIDRTVDKLIDLALPALIPAAFAYGELRRVTGSI